MENQKRRVAIYARVSTGDQDSENQLIGLREYCGARRWEVVADFVDEISGTTDQRSKFQAMNLAAHQKRFNIVLFWALDRFSREGVTETLNHLRYLQSCGVDFVSFREPYLNSLGVFREAIVGFLAGLARAKIKGKKLGRPINSAYK